MHRSLSPVSEDDQHTSSSSATSSEDLPTVTPITRTFTATIERQNDENEKLRKKIAQLQATLKATRADLHDTAKVLAANVSRAPHPSTPPMSLPVPSSPLGLTPRLPRPQDVAYQTALKGQQTNIARETAEEFKTEDGIMKSSLNLLTHLPRTTTLTSPLHLTSPARMMSGRPGTANSAPT